MKKRRFHWGEVLLLLLASPLLYAAEKKGAADADSRNGEAAGETVSAVHLNLTEEWDKTFPRSRKVEHKKVIFHNRYGIPLAADMYIPKGKSGMALNAAAADTRIKATVAVTMYDMSRVTANGYFDAMDEEARYKLRESLNAQRTADYRNGTYALAGGVVDPLPEEAPFFVKDYYAYYKTPRGYHPRSLNSNGGWNVTSALSFLNMPILAYAGEIRSAVLLVHGEKAHSCYFSKDAFAKLKGDNKELMLIPDAVHTDLYDKTQIIPFDKIAEFLNANLR